MRFTLPVHSATIDDSFSGGKSCGCGPESESQMLGCARHHRAMLETIGTARTPPLRIEKRPSGVVPLPDPPYGDSETPPGKSLVEFLFERQIQAWLTAGPNNQLRCRGKELFSVDDLFRLAILKKEQ
jgi:hypothetical protein